MALNRPASVHSKKPVNCENHISQLTGEGTFQDSVTATLTKFHFFYRNKLLYLIPSTS